MKVYLCVLLQISFTKEGIINKWELRKGGIGIKDKDASKCFPKTN